jgi:ribosomal protein S17E
MKIGPVGAQFYHADRQTDKHDEANNRCSQISRKASKKLRNSVMSVYNKLEAR